MEIAKRAACLAGVANCTPGYNNREGEVDRERSQAEQMNAAKAAIWGQGIESFLEVIQAWRA